MAVKICIQLMGSKSMSSGSEYPLSVLVYIPASQTHIQTASSKCLIIISSDLNFFAVSYNYICIKCPNVRMNA